MRSFASLKEGNVKASKNEPTKGERTKGKRPEGLNGTREGREGERIQVFSPIMACIFSPGPSASTFNISPLCENIGSFFLPRTNSIKGGKRSFSRSPSFHLFHGSRRGKSLRSKSCGKTSTVGEVKLWRVGARGRQTYQTPREGFAPHSLSYVLPALYRDRLKSGYYGFCDSRILSHSVSGHYTKPSGQSSADPSTQLII